MANVMVVILTPIKGGLRVVNEFGTWVLPHTRLFRGDMWAEEAKQEFKEVYNQVPVEPTLEDVLMIDGACIVTCYLPLTCLEPNIKFSVVTLCLLGGIREPYRTVAENYFKSLNVKEDK